jgi:hypothetical protein
MRILSALRCAASKSIRTFEFYGSHGHGAHRACALVVSRGPLRPQLRSRARECARDREGCGRCERVQRSPIAAYGLSFYPNVLRLFLCSCGCAQNPAPGLLRQLLSDPLWLSPRPLSLRISCSAGAVIVAYEVPPWRGTRDRFLEPRVLAEALPARPAFFAARAERVRAGADVLAAVLPRERVASAGSGEVLARLIPRAAATTTSPA